MCAEVQSQLPPDVLNDANRNRNRNRNRRNCTTSIRSYFRFCQPSHLVVLLFALFFASTFKSAQRNPTTGAIVNLLYIGSFAFHFGAQMWMTFISGIVLFFTIPRHMFGLVQEQLFPRYFLLNSVLSFITVTTFLLKYPAQQSIQFLVLCSCFFIHMLTWLYLVPPILATMKRRWILEKNAGVGSEIGPHKSESLRQCEHYGRLYKCFRRLHSIAAIANMATVACNGIHLYHLAELLTNL